MPDLTELRLLLDKATARPWTTCDGRSWVGLVSAGDGYELADTCTTADADLIVAAVNALPDLLDAAEALERVRALAEDWRYKGEYGWGPWQAGEGPDPEGAALDWAASKIRRAIDGEPQP